MLGQIAYEIDKAVVSYVLNEVVWHHHFINIIKDTHSKSTGRTAFLENISSNGVNFEDSILNFPSPSLFSHAFLFFFFFFWLSGGMLAYHWQPTNFVTPDMCVFA